MEVIYIILTVIIALVLCSFGLCFYLVYKMKIQKELVNEINDTISWINVNINSDSDSYLNSSQFDYDLDCLASNIIELSATYKDIV